MRSHEIDYEIIGNEMQIVEIELDPGETVIAEAGAMNYMDSEIGFEARMGDGSAPEGGLVAETRRGGETASHRGVSFYDPLHQPG